MTEQTFPPAPADRRWTRTMTGLVLGLALMTTGVACGNSGNGNRVATANGSASATTSAGPGHGDALKFAQCMRANGIAEFPDPDPNSNAGPKGPPGPPDERIKAATEKCKQYMP